MKTIVVTSAILLSAASIDAAEIFSTISGSLGPREQSARLTLTRLQCRSRDPSVELSPNYPHGVAKSRT